MIILQCGPPSFTLPKKAFISPSVWPKKEHIWKLNWKESLLIYCENYQGAPCSHRQSRNRIMDTSIIVNITPTPSYPLQKGIPSHFTWALISKKSLLITVLFWMLPGYSLFLHRQSRQRMVNTLLMIKINPTYKRLLICICQGKNRNLACISNKPVINC